LIWHSFAPSSPPLSPAGHAPSPPHSYQQVKLPCAAALSSGRKDSPALHEVIPVQDFLAHVISLQPPWKLKARELAVQELGKKKSLEEGTKA